VSLPPHKNSDDELEAQRWQELCDRRRASYQAEAYADANAQAMSMAIAKKADKEMSENYDSRYKSPYDYSMKKDDPYEELKPSPFGNDEYKHRSSFTNRESLLQAQEAVQDAADELARRTVFEVDDLASEVADKRLLRMSVEELDAAKKAAFEKNAEEMRLKVVSIDAREATVSAVEQDQLNREANLQDELKSLEKETKRARSTLVAVKRDIGLTQDSIAEKKTECQGMVTDLKDALIRVESLESEFWEMKQKAKEFVDNDLLAYFEEGDEE
jgi:hypothetical protein